MIDALITLAGWESSWRYLEGRDKSANNTSACTMEAGLYQTSANSSYFGADLKILMENRCKNWAGKTLCEKFTPCTKYDKAFTHEYTARLLRHTIRHHGPVLRGDVTKWVSPQCVKQLEEIL